MIMPARRCLLALAATLLAAAPCLSADTVTLDATQQSRAGILVRPVLVRAFGEQVPVAGEVVRAPGETLSVKLAVPGRVIERAVQPGDEVSPGAVLMRVHSDEAHELQADLRRAERELELARIRYDNGQKLYDLDGISRLELEERKQRMMSAELAFDRHRHHLEQLGLSAMQIEQVLADEIPMGQLTVRAPVGGTVLDMPMAVHEWFEPYQTLAVVGSPAELELQLQVQPSAAARIARGDVLDFAPVGRPKQAGKGKVITSIPEMDPVTRTVKARAEILESGGALFPGIYVQGMLVHGDSRRSPSVPEKALTRIGDADYVFVRREQGTFEARQVELGQLGENRYEILSGLSEGEEVVVEGVFFLKSTLLQGGEEE
jgi:cobalt-zinc-cadmium efflux system membrane fusion protein